MRTKKFLSFISFVGIISFSVSNVAGAAGPNNKIQEITKAPAAMRVGIVRNSEEYSSEALKERGNLGKEGVGEKGFSGSQGNEMGKDTLVSSSDEKGVDIYKIALCTGLTVFTLLVLSVVLIVINSNSNSTEKEEVLYNNEIDILNNSDFKQDY